MPCRKPDVGWARGWQPRSCSWRSRDAVDELSCRPRPLAKLFPYLGLCAQRGNLLGQKYTKEALFCPSVGTTAAIYFNRRPGSQISSFYERDF